MRPKKTGVVARPLDQSLRQKAVFRPLDPSDLRNLSHPSHKNAWLELADAIGRFEAREEIRLRREKAGEELAERNSETSRPVCAFQL